MIIFTLLMASVLGVFFMVIRHDNYQRLRIERGIPYCKKHGDSCLKGCMHK
jgi:hypothetical protein